MLQSYRALMSAPGAARAAACKLFGVLPDTAYPVMLLLLVAADSGSFAWAGAVSAAAAAGVFALTIPFGQWATRPASHAARARRLWLLGAVSAVACAGHAAVSVLDLAVWLHLPLAAVSAGMSPPFASLLRERWSRIVDESTLNIAHGWENTISEILACAGPLTAAAAAAAGVLAGWFVICAVMIVMATGLLTALPHVGAPEGAPDGALRWLRSHRPVWLPLAVEGASCATWSMLLLGGLSAAEHADRPASGGLIAAIISAGAVAGAMWMGGRAQPDRISGQVAAAMAATAAVAAGCAVLADSLLAVGALCLAAGVAGGATSTAVFVWTDLEVPEPRRLLAYQAFSVICAASGMGADLLAGVIADRSGPAAVFATAGALAAVTAAAAVFFPRSRLTPGGEPG